MPFRMKRSEDIVPIGAKGSWVLDKEGLAATGLGLIAIITAAVSFDASATEALLTGVFAFIAGAASMPFRMK